MRRAALSAIAILAAQPAEACHRFHIWKYPWRQTCRVTALAPTGIRSLQKIEVVPVEREIPLPSLTDIDWGTSPDDELRGRLWLRATLRKEDK